MNVYLISYDLHSPGQDYEKVHEAIKSINPKSWAKVLESLWLVPSNLSIVQIRDRIANSMDRNDRLFVTEISYKPVAAANLPDKVWKWIEQNVQQP